MAGLHWLTFTVRGPRAAAVLDALRCVGEFHEAKRGTSKYRQRWDGPHGATVEAGFRLSGCDHVRVDLPGDACEALNLASALGLVRQLGGKVTR